MYQNIVLHIPHGSDYIPKQVAEKIALLKLLWGSHGALRRSTEHSVGENSVTINFYGARTAHSADRSEFNEQEPGFKSPHIHRSFCI